MSSPSHSASSLNKGLLFGLLLALGTVLLAQSEWLERIDLLIYDLLVQHQFREPPAQITIIAIDEKSLSELGRWPWSRTLHAELLDRLTDSEVSAVAFDILFPEPESDTADKRFAEAMERNGRTVLAVSPEQGSTGALIAESLPIPLLASSAAGLGHVDIELDVDGLCRSVFLRAGLGSPHWPTLAEMVMRIADYPPPLSDDGTMTQQPVATSIGWRRADKILIPFAGPTGHIQRLSYVDVLKGRTAPDLLKKKMVLVGSIAAGLGDALSTPAARQHDRMPGVELNANILYTLIEGGQIKQVSQPTHLMVSGAVVLISVLSLILLPIRSGFSIVILYYLSTLAWVTLLLWSGKVWFPPSAILTLQLISYPLWSWLKSSAESHTLQHLTHRVEHQARHHSVTELPNQTALEEYLQTAINRMDKKQLLLGLIVINLGELGRSNDALGFAGGAQILKEVTARLQRCIRQNDMLAHLSGNDFVIVIENLNDFRPVKKIGALLVQTFQQPFDRDKDEIYLSAHIGASIYPNDGSDADTLIRNAFTAMLKARDDETKGLYFFSEEIKAEHLAKTHLERLLRHALEREQLVVHYQPQVTAGTGKIIGVEALLRWHSPELGLVGPEQFIPVAERTGLIIEIGQWVLFEACRQTQEWINQGLNPIRLAVNISPLQFAQSNLVATTAKILEQTGLPAHLLELEITESALIQDLSSAIEALTAFKQMGIRVAIDDFGTGYSSLGYLQRFPLDRIKIDRSFVNEIGPSSPTGEIILSIIQMAHRLQLEVIAEGVEHPDQMAFLNSHACDELQGFLYGKAMPAEELFALLKATAPLTQQMPLPDPDTTLNKPS
ncbi:MAG: EAL domain-containing protein [Sedimenticola sp.]|nr:EAL domain-containing protein [Sedimenticola sp.]